MIKVLRFKNLTTELHGVKHGFARSYTRSNTDFVQDSNSDTPF
jgi:hypothetical protein